MSGNLGAFMALAITLLSLTAFVAAGTFISTAPAWFLGRITPRKKQRDPRTLLLWFILGVIPLAAAITFGPFSGATQLLPGAVAIPLGVFGVLSANVFAYSWGRSTLRTAPHQIIPERG